VAQHGNEESTGVKGPQTPKNPEADEIEENVDEKGGGPEGVAVPQGGTPDEEGKRQD
jgi:hypothetical protein